MADDNEQGEASEIRETDSESDSGEGDETLVSLTPDEGATIMDLFCDDTEDESFHGFEDEDNEEPTE